ncbi:MAG: 30S ribosomal protein S8 [bacterium]|nr:30S ribosomal protein S8 [bacterium]
MMTDPIADMLTRIRNAQAVGKKTVDLTFSKLKMNISSILVSEGYIKKSEKIESMPPVLRLELKYIGKKPAIQSIKRESKPGHRKYCKSDEIPKILNDYGIAILSTSKGLMTNKQARKDSIGGELICSIY